jgi:hypothetical protein
MDQSSIDPDSNSVVPNDVDIDSRDAVLISEVYVTGEVVGTTSSRGKLVTVGDARGKVIERSVVQDAGSLGPRADVVALAVEPRRVVVRGAAVLVVPEIVVLANVVRVRGGLARRV